MATHHGGKGQPWDRDDILHGKDIEVNILHHEDTGDFERVEQENHTNLANFIRELNDLCHRVQAGEDQPVEALLCIEHELQRLSITLQ